MVRERTRNGQLATVEPEGKMLQKVMSSLVGMRNEDESFHPKRRSPFTSRSMLVKTSESAVRMYARLRVRFVPGLKAGY
jgi:hypothetical protein